MKVLLACVIIFALNYILTFFQAKEIQSAYKRVSTASSKNYISVGKSRKILKKGSVSIISVNEEGFIEAAELLEGRTIFAKFKSNSAIVGKNVAEVFNTTDNPAVRQSVEFVIERFEKEKEKNEI